MRVLMVNTNRLRSPQCVLPLGLCQVAAAAEDAGHEVRLLDLCFIPSVRKAIRSAVSKFGPDVVGLSIRNLDNSDAVSPRSYVAEVARVVSEFRECHDGPLVIGGPGVSIAPFDFAARLCADYAFVGEGEWAFPCFLDCLANGKDPVSECGVIRASSAGETGLPPPSPFPSAMFGRLDLRRYAAYGSPIPIQTKRGCTRECVYCTYPAIEGSEYRLKPAGEVADEIGRCAACGTFRSVEFVDSTFNCPSDHAISVCAELEKRGNRLPLHTTSINPSCAPTELLRLMERAGFTAIASSVESASDEVLEAMKKGYTARDVLETIRSARMTSMARMWVFIFGGPGETERTAAETLAFIRKYVNERDLVLVTVGLRIYPGTELEAIARREGVLREGHDPLTPTFYVSPAVGRERLTAMIRSARLSHSGTIFISDMGSAALPIAQRIHTALGFPQPYWRHAGAMGRFRRVSRRIGRM